VFAYPRFNTKEGKARFKDFGSLAPAGTSGVLGTIGKGAAGAVH
jgi:hypothetical protein